MIPKKVIFPTVLCVVLVLTAATVFAQDSFRDKEIKQLAAWMTGSFDTFAQVNADEEVDAKYRHIRATLQVVPVKIAGTNDALALYIENATAETRTKPYRQRVYVLKRENGKIVVEIHKINKPEDFTGAHKNPKLLEALTLERLTHEKGCDMTFQKINAKLYKGSAGTNKTCQSTLRGSTHTISNTEVTQAQIANLDQGFDDTGAHKWGPPPSVIGHIFIKRKTEN